MTEDQIERWVERHMDSLDAALMAGRLSQREYDQRCAALNAAVALKYHGLRGTPIEARDA